MLAEGGRNYRPPSPASTATTKSSTLASVFEVAATIYQQRRNEERTTAAAAGAFAVATTGTFCSEYMEALVDYAIQFKTSPIGLSYQPDTLDDITALFHQEAAHDACYPAPSSRPTPCNHSCRLFYTNPVCFLTTLNDDLVTNNVMTVSWLTCTNNQGGLFLSLNEKRATTRNLLREFDASADGDGSAPLLALSLACAGQETDLVRCGTTSGDNKVERLRWKMVRPGWPSAEEVAAEEGGESKQGSSSRSKKEQRRGFIQRGCQTLTCHARSYAHVVCVVRSMMLVDAHYHVLCDIVVAYVRPEYQRLEGEGAAVFYPRNGGGPGGLKFLGSKLFDS